MAATADNTNADTATQELDMLETAERQRAVADNTAAEEAGRGGWRRNFKEWKQRRPFVPGLLLILSGAVLITPAYLSVRVLDILVMISTISGVSTLVLGIIQIALGLFVWRYPISHGIVGILAMVFAVVALPTSNFGGFFLGTLLGLVGGALCIGWMPGESPRGKTKASANVAHASLRGAGAIALLVGALVMGGFVVPLPQSISQQSADQQLGILKNVGGVVRAQRVVVRGKVSVTAHNVATTTTPVGVVELRGDDIAVEQLTLQVPGKSGEKKTMRQESLDKVRLRGNAVLRVTSLTATPEVVGAPTLPITIDATTPPADILPKLGIPQLRVPDRLMEVVALRNVRLDVVSLTADSLEAPFIQLA